jgi:hypothetical protein
MNGLYFVAELKAAEAGCLEEWLRFNDLVDVRAVLPSWAENVAGLCWATSSPRSGWGTGGR